MDLRVRFSATYRQTGTRFESLIDTHWNAFGHAEAARALFERLQALGLATPDLASR